MQIHSLADVLNKLYFKKQSNQLIGFEKEKQGLYEILEATITQRRGDSSLIVGPRSSGKSVIVNQCLEQLAKAYPEQFILIRLEGLLHNDDRSAFREVARQLDQINGFKDEMSIEKVSMNSTLQEIFALFGRAEHEAYSAEGPKRVSVVFVLEEMDRFAVGQRQSLLYNLLDFSKNSSLGVAVVGTSTKFTAQEALEKRVRSRFGSLIFHTTRATTPEMFDEIAKTLLKCDNDQWNAAIDACLEQGGALRTIVDTIYYTTKDVRDLGQVLAPVIHQNYEAIYNGTISVPELELLPHNVAANTETRLENMCELDWAIVICSARVLAKYKVSEVNFVLADREYREMARNLHYDRSQGGYSGYRIWSPKAVKLAWERLQGLSILAVPAATNATHGDLMPFRLDTTLDELRLLVPSDHPLYEWTRL